MARARVPPFLSTAASDKYSIWSQWHIFKEIDKINLVRESTRHSIQDFKSRPCQTAHQEREVRPSQSIVVKALAWIGA